MAKANREFKNSVFCDYLSEDTGRLVEIFNAAFHTSFPRDIKVRLNTLDGVLFRDRINDLSYVLENMIITLSEHQSTLNENIALRDMIYMGRAYEEYLSADSRSIYRKKLIPLPTPVCIVLYNGKEHLPEYSVRKLSDSFIWLAGFPTIELTVHIYNIRITNGKIPDILKRCRCLFEYSTFVAAVTQVY